MSKKVVAFTLPLKSARPEPEASSGAGPDAWVQTPPDAQTLPPATGKDHVVIDLSATRTWFELVQLMYVFPYLATSCWMENAAGTWLGSIKPR